MSLNAELFPVIAPVPEASAPRPFWSVIVPAYRARYLEPALLSVLAQDPGAEHMQIIVQDDASADALEAIVRRLGGERIDYERQAVNLGTYATENAALRRARGIWTHVLNDDDWVLPGFYAAFEAALRDQPPSVGAACCAFVHADEHGETSEPSLPLRLGAGMLPDWARTVGSRNPLHPIAVVVRRSVHEHLGGYCPTLGYCADWEFFKRAASFYDWYYVPRALAAYREYEGNTTSGGLANGAQVRDIARCIELSRQYLPEPICDQATHAARENYAAHALRTAAYFLRLARPEAGLRVLNAGLELSTSPEVLHGVLELLASPDAEALRRALPELLRSLEASPQWSG